MTNRTQDVVFRELRNRIGEEVLIVASSPQLNL